VGDRPTPKGSALKSNSPYTEGNFSEGSSAAIYQNNGRGKHTGNNSQILKLQYEKPTTAILQNLVFI
jgi:hypothetical protein